MASLTVKIKNQSGLPNEQRYIAFFGDVSGKVASNSRVEFRSIMFFRTKALSDGQQDSFKFTADLYGFIGRSSAQSLAVTHTVSSWASQPVQVGRTNLNDGTELVVKPSGKDIQLTTSATNKSDPGSFTIWSQNSIPSPNYFVTGLARMIDSEVKPVAAIPVIPGQQFIVTPDLTLYVAISSDDDEDAVVDGNKANLIKVGVSLGAGQTLVVVTNKKEGDKNVLKVA